MKESQRKYLEEYEKYKHIEISLGTYCVKNRPHLVYEIISVDQTGDTATLQREGATQVKTLHWCRKKLERREA